MNIRMCTAHRTSEHRRWWNDGWTCLVYQMGTCSQARCSKASHASGEDNGILRTRRVLNIRLSVTLVSSYTWLVSLVSLLRWNKEECKRNKLFVITVTTQECLQGRNSLPCFAITLNNSFARLSQHTSCLFNSSAQIYTPPKKKPSTLPPPVISALIQTAVMLSWGFCPCFLFACFVLVLAVLWSISKEICLNIKSDDYIPLLKILHWPSPLNEIPVLYVDYLLNLTTFPTMLCYCLLILHKSVAWTHRGRFCSKVLLL